MLRTTGETHQKSECFFQFSCQAESKHAQQTPFGAVQLSGFCRLLALSVMLPSLGVPLGVAS